MSRPVFDIEQESDGWWMITRNGWHLDGSEFTTREKAEAAVDQYEREDEEAEEETDEAEDRGDWRYHQDHDQ